jgi:hypothetical protein
LYLDEEVTNKIIREVTEMPEKNQVVVVIEEKVSKEPDVILHANIFDVDTKLLERIKALTNHENSVINGVNRADHFRDVSAELFTVEDKSITIHEPWNLITEDEINELLPTVKEINFIFEQIYILKR